MSGPYDLPIPGAIIGGRYRIVRLLGNGGMGVVFEAVHQRLRQSVAIKILRPELARSQEFLVRFDREARAAARLRSPHVVRIFDVDTTPEDLTYMVMELLEGNDLADEIQRSPSIAPSDLADWVIQCCDAMREAHGKGIVHRDLKPANIFLARGPGGRIAKILDFGISKFLGEGTPFSIRGAAIGGPAGATWGVIGTPEYMAPEQINVGGTIDGRADIWALGMVLYRALSHRSPFAGASSTEHMLAVVADPAIPFETVRPDLPLELAAVIMTALEKKPDDRYQTAEELASALLPFGAGRGPLAARDSMPEDDRPDRARMAPSLPPVDDRLSDTIRSASPFEPAGFTPVEKLARRSDVPPAPLPITENPARPRKEQRRRVRVAAVVALILALVASLGVYALTHAH